MKKLQQHFYLILISHFLFAGCGSYSSDEDKMDGNLHTVVSSMSPDDGEASVYTNTSVSVTFSKEMNSSTITTNSSDTSCSGTLQVSSDNFSTCVQMSTSPAASNSNKTYTATPSSRLPYGTNHKVRLSNIIKSDSGENILGQYTTPTGFTSINITVSSTSPADSETSVNINSNISITLSEPVDTSTVTTNTSDTSCSGTFQVSSNNFSSCIRMSDSPVAFSDNHSYTVSPNSNLEYHTTYKIRVTTGVSNSSNDTLSSQYESSVGFKTLGKFVAVGQDGSSDVDGTTLSLGNIWTSSDTLEWTPIKSGTNSALLSITYGNNTYVTVGRDGIIQTSPQGNSWDNRTSGTGGRLNQVAFGNNTFVVVGSNGVILTSSDNGTSWTSRTSGTSKAFSGVTFGNNKFVAVGGQGRVYYSSDNGTSWNINTTGTTLYHFYAITYGNNKFVAVGEYGYYYPAVFTSSDGISWESSSGQFAGSNNEFKSNRFTKATYGNNIYVLQLGIGSNFMAYSSDGISWDATPTFNNIQPTTICFGKDTFLAMDHHGKTLTSTDGINWTINEIQGMGYTNFFGVTYSE